MINLRRLTKQDLEELYVVMYSGENPEWTKYNAPYFNEYQFMDFETFMKEEHHQFYLTEQVHGIFLSGKLIGVVTKYWESFATRWLEVGIVIYDDRFWSKGIGKIALEMWIEKCFHLHPEIEHVGLTTWSGNIGMMKLSEKIGMKLEAQIRKVRYYNGIYYDSVKYGILREEFFEKDRT